MPTRVGNDRVFTDTSNGHWWPALAVEVACELETEVHSLSLPHCASAMAPKKKVKGKAIVSGEACQALATSMDTVCPLMVAAQVCVDSMYSLRHTKPETKHDKSLPGLTLEGGDFGWPVMGGGTFKDIAQRAWGSDSRDKLVELSWEMVSAAGLLDPGSSVDTFKEKYLTLKDRPGFNIVVPEICLL